MKLLLLAAVAGSAIAASGPATDPASLDPGTAFADIKPDQPGCAYEVDRRGTILWKGTFGLANLTSGEPIADRTRFELASTSKQFTGMALLVLERQGKVKLTSSIRAYMPELPPAYQPVKVSDLLHHTSGIREYLDVLRTRGTAEATPRSRADIQHIVRSQQGLDGPPGGRFSYVNTNYALLSELIARRSGMTFPDFVRKYVFVPANMSNTETLPDTLSPKPGDTAGYQKAAAGGFVREDWGWYGYGDKGVRTSILDMAQWHKATLDAAVGGPQVQQRRLEEGRLRSGHPFHYAAGIFVDRSGDERVIWHSGLMAGNRSYDILYLDRGIGVSVMCNRSDIAPVDKARQIVKLVLPDAPAPGFDQPVDRAALSKLGTIADLSLAPEGYYVDRRYGIFLQVRQTPGQPIVSYNGRADRVTRRDTGLYAGRRGVMVGYATDRRGGKRVVQLTDSGPLAYDYVGPAVPAVSGFTEGRYHSTELDLDITLKHGRPGWTIATPVGELPLAGASTGDLVGPDAAISLHPDGAGRLRLHTPNLNGIAFRLVR